MKILKPFLQSRATRLFLYTQLLIFIGTSGWMLVEGWNFQDSIYMTVTTLTTIGYGEIHPLSEAGRWFNLVMIFFGVGMLAYMVSQIAEGIFEQGLKDLFWGRKKMVKQIQNLHDHVILCGFGQMGKQVAKTLSQKGTPLVIIEKNNNQEVDLRESGFNYLIGSAENDQLLQQAGIERARALITAVTSDAENVFITLTARALNKNLTIVARAFEESSTPKLLRAGASKVISPYAHAGLKMASAIINPGVDTFLEIVANESLLEIQMADVLVGHNSPYLGKSLIEAQSLFHKKNLMLVGIKRKEGPIELANKSLGKVEESDRLIVIGDGTMETSNWQS